MGSPELSAGRLPNATYRVQFNSSFTFSDAKGIVEYLNDLGISHLYASPVFKAGPESTHGYDICGFGQLNPNLGSEAEFQSLSQALAVHSMGLLLDMVPNHMGSDLSNAWWFDVLEKGPASTHARWFDIDWEPVASELHNKVLLPTLEDRLSRVLADRKLQLEFISGSGFAIAYYDHRLPVSLASYEQLLGTTIEKLGSASEAASLLREVLRHKDNLDELKKALVTAASSSTAVHEALKSTTLERSADPDSLYELLQQQHYKLAYWRVGPEEINYRRFFDITQLVSIRVEDPVVFGATHELILRLLRTGLISALRIDHPDGLWDPQQYCARIQSSMAEPIYLIVEKILTGNEQLPRDWPVHGTTGYDFLNLMNGIFVDSKNAEKFDSLYHDFTRLGNDFEALAYESKRKILECSFISELDALTHNLKRLATQTLAGADFTRRELRSALAAMIAAFPVYRTYINSQTTHVSEDDANNIREAFDRARLRSNPPEMETLQFLKRVILLEQNGANGAPSASAFLRFIGKFQQLTGPVMAKGLEDTAFYNFNRLISLNEVGGTPDQFGISVDEFHCANQKRASEWPHSLLASATHDTKRGEDVRARLNVLSEMPDQWRETVFRWRNLNLPWKTTIDGRHAPDANDEFLFYQSIIGVWRENAKHPDHLPAFRERLQDYMTKAIKESKRHTSWTSVDEPYERATVQFIEKALSTSNSQFLKDVSSFLQPIAFYGAINSLAQVLLKCCCPGLPDFYQGTELMDLTLVDPDNRRKVDYRLRQDLLKRLQDANGFSDFVRDALLDLSSGQAKFFVVWRSLNFRKQHPGIFQAGQYLPLAATGAHRRNVCSFARVQGNTTLIVVVPRFVSSLCGPQLRLPLGPAVWEDTCLDLSSLPETQLKDVFTGEGSKPAKGKLLVSECLHEFPVALLTSMSNQI